MLTGDKAAGLVGLIAEVFPGAKYQRCTVRFYRNALAKAPQIQALPGRGHAQGDPHDKIARRVGGKGGIRRRRARVDGAQGGGEGGSRGLHRDADVLRNTARALAAHPHEQRDRAAQQGNPR